LNNEKMQTLRAQALAAAGLPQFPAEVLEQLEKRHQRRPHERWKRAKARIRAAWEQFLGPGFSAERLDDPVPVPNLNAAGLPSDRVTFQLLQKVVGTMVGMNADTIAIKEHQQRQFELLWGAVQLLAREEGVDIVQELKSQTEPGEINAGAKADIAELQRMLGLSEEPKKT
jgi:hypothetical protein